MTRNTRPALRGALLAAMFTALLSVTGCSTSVTGTPAADPAPAPTEGPGSDPVAWVDRVCGGVLAAVGPATAPPDFSTMKDLPTLKSTYSAWLGSVITGTQQARAQLGAVGRSPVAEGDDVVAKAQDALAKLEQDFTGARTAVDGADPNNAETFVGTLGQVQTTLTGITAPNVLAGVVAVPRLGPAAGRAAQCQKLSAMSATPPR
jgi:hypothetical protein